MSVLTPHDDIIISAASFVLCSVSKRAMLSPIQETQPLLSVLAPLPADEPIALLQAFHLLATCHGKFVAHILDTSYHL
jgi:hypothetical protein